MHSVESSNSPSAEPALALDLRFPEPTAPLREHWPLQISWLDAIRGFALFRERYMREADSPEARLREKNPRQFRLE